MSIQAVGWVLDNSAARGVDRLVLISLANHANALDLCWPAQRTIAREAGIATGTVSNALARLVTLGELEIVKVGDNRRSATYHLIRPVPGFECSPDERSVHPGVSAASIPGVDRTVMNQEQEILLTKKEEETRALFERDERARRNAAPPPWTRLGISHREWLDLETAKANQEANA